MDFVKLGWDGMNWVRIGWIRSSRVEVSWVSLTLVGLGWVELDWVKEGHVRFGQASHLRISGGLTGSSHHSHHKTLHAFIRADGEISPLTVMTSEGVILALL